jgi:hypothetical protein
MWMPERDSTKEEKASTSVKREKLLAEREEIQQEILRLKDAPILEKSRVGPLGRIEDLKALATKMIAIDKKLGRHII